MRTLDQKCATQRYENGTVIMLSQIPFCSSSQILQARHVAKISLTRRTRYERRTSKIRPPSNSYREFPLCWEKSIRVWSNLANEVRGIEKKRFQNFWTRKGGEALIRERFWIFIGPRERTFRIRKDMNERSRHLHVDFQKMPYCLAA